jgi:predicted ATPase/DNA-binding XRE family transcriptional regulator
MARDPAVAPGAAALTFGQRLRSLREAAGWSQEELAERARMSTEAVSALERGTRTRPYPATVRALAAALELAPEESRALVEAVRRGSQTTISRSRATIARRGGRLRAGGLPLSATPLLGREDDVAAVSELLSSPAVRLATLTGIGGIGKTRLAVAVAERAGPSFADGVAYVPLAPILDEALVWPEVGRALGVEATGQVEGPEEILEVAVNLELLLVLDNCEHLPGVAGVVVNLLDRCLDLTVLVTSRAPLRLRAETEYMVPPLGLPPLGTTDLSGLDASPAASLLLQRGRGVRRDFVVRPGDGPAVAEICHRLAGLPLALELAAAGLRVLDPAALLAHLDEVLGRGGPVDLPARQRTMAATLDWSYGLLSEQDQLVFRRASVFVGGFTLTAAEAVTGGSEVLAAVDRLAAQSLCTAIAVEGGIRYGMLEPVAEYARSLLDERENATARRCHATYFVDVAEQSWQALRGVDSLKALRLLDTEESNMWSAADWAIRSGRADLAGRFIWALLTFWWVRGRGERARSVAADVLAMESTEAVRARALHLAAAFAEPGTEPETVERLYLDSLALAERSGDLDVEATSAIGAGLIALERQDPSTAEQRLQRALSAAQRSGEAGEWSAGLAHTWLASARRFQHDASGAVAHAQQALASADRRGDVLSRCIALYDLGHAKFALGEHALARQHLLDGVGLCSLTRDATNLSYLLDALAAVELATGGRERVATLLGAAEALRTPARAAVYRWYGPDMELRQETADNVSERLGEAGYQRALDAGRSLTLEGAVEFARRQVPAGG